MLKVSGSFVCDINIHIWQVNFDFKRYIYIIFCWYFLTITQGGILWFNNLTEFPHGALGPVFPILVAGLHYLNVQVLYCFVSSFFLCV